jgi:type IV secretory pathway TrbD component
MTDGGGAKPVLHRAALERVLQRAAELHAASTEVPETLTEEELLSLASEVGISSTALKQALVEERMRVVLPEEQGILASVTGPATFIASRVVKGTPAELLARLNDELGREENLKERRRFPDRMVWGPRGGFAGTIRELTRLDGRGFPLARADEVSATAVAAEGGRSHVRLEVLLHGRRIGAAQAATMGIISGSGLAAIAMALNVNSIVAALGGLLIAGSATYMARRNYRRDARLTQLAVEQTLDRLEFGEPKRRALFSGL